MRAAKITALPSFNDCRPLEGLKPSRSHPKTLTSCSQCHLFRTGTGVNLAVLANSELGCSGAGTCVPGCAARCLAQAGWNALRSSCCNSSLERSFLQIWPGKHTVLKFPTYATTTPKRPSKSLLERALAVRVVPSPSFPSPGSKPAPSLSPVQVQGHSTITRKSMF